MSEQSIIKRCDCKHEYQDKCYGKQMRIHNKANKDRDGGWRCTVCGKKKPL